MRHIKDIFRKETRSETLKMEFSPAKLLLEGTLIKQASYELESTRLNRYGTYLSKDAEVASNYRIHVPLKHILSVIRISDTIEGEISSAMEVLDTNLAMCFFFTKNRDYTFTIGIGSIEFENLDGGLIEGD